MNKKGQTGGLITALIFGVASLVIGVIIAFVIVGTLVDADLLSKDTATITNESGWVNETDYTLAATSEVGAGGYSITALFNNTSGAPFLVANSTVTSAGIVTNASDTTIADALISYRFSRDSAETQSTSGLSANFTAGVNQVALKIPTVLLVAAIVLILGVLSILVLVWQRMKLGDGTL